MSRKKCGHCQFSVPSNASVCGHCGAQFRKVADKSISGRIGSAFGYGIIGIIICVLAFALLEIEINDKNTRYIYYAAGAAAVFGLFKGGDKEITRR